MKNDFDYIEYVTTDTSATCAFLEKAFGWKFTAMGPEMGHSFVATLPNGTRCGVREPLSPTETPITRTYVRVDDLDRAVKRAAELGAEIMLPSMDLPGQGRIGIYLLNGVEQGVWERE